MGRTVSQPTSSPQMSPRSTSTPLQSPRDSAGALPSLPQVQEAVPQPGSPRLTVPQLHASATSGWCGSRSPRTPSSSANFAKLECENDEPPASRRLKANKMIAARMSSRSSDPGLCVAASSPQPGAPPTPRATLAAASLPSKPEGVAHTVPDSQGLRQRSAAPVFVSEDDKSTNQRSVGTDSLAFQHLLVEELGKFACDQKQSLREVVREELDRALASRCSPSKDFSMENGRVLGSLEQGRVVSDESQTGAFSESVQMTRSERQRNSSDRELDRLEEHVGELQLDPLSFVDTLASFSPWLDFKPSERRFYEATKCLGRQHAPPKSGCISKFVDSIAFRLIVNFVIVLNVAFMAYQADFAVKSYLEPGRTDMLIDVGEYVFLALYTIEFLLKVTRHGHYYFTNESWYLNWIDLSLLILSFYFVFFDDLLPNFSWLRMIRLLKLAKALRVFRLVSVFQTLRAILKSLAATLGTLGWSLALLSAILFVFALTFTLLTGIHFTGGETIDADVQDDLLRAFGTVDTAFINLFKCITGGADWEFFYNAASHLPGPSTLIFLFFIAFTNIAVLNIILGLFVDEAMKAMVPEREVAARAHAHDVRTMEETLRKALHDADTSHDGTIEAVEWARVVRETDLISYLDLIGFKSENVLGHFKQLAKRGNGTVQVDEFVRGCMHMKGASTAFDMHVVLTELDYMKAIMREENAALARLLKKNAA